LVEKWGGVGTTQQTKRAKSKEKILKYIRNTARGRFKAGPAKKAPYAK